MDEKLILLREEISKCRKCSLAHSRHHVIFGEGNFCAPIFLIGEAPGREEDLIGRPFVGESGLVLDKILAACGFTRNEHVFISNVVKCRPPGNRVPTHQQAVACLPWLMKQIELINPKILVLLGATALKYIAGSDYRITRDRGKWLNCSGRLAMPVYHPAALLRNPGLRRETWEDFKKIVMKYRELVDPRHYSPYM
ncbi:MAG: uracil-DNA glycosylase [Acutalibacteraceae bacterium]